MTVAVADVILILKNTRSVQDIGVAEALYLLWLSEDWTIRARTAANEGYIFAWHPDIDANADAVRDIRGTLLFHETHREGRLLDEAIRCGFAPQNSMSLGGQPVGLMIRCSTVRATAARRRGSRRLFVTPCRRRGSDGQDLGCV